MGGRLVRFYIHGVMGCFHLDESEDGDSILRPTVQFLNPRKNIAIALTDCHVDQVVQGSIARSTLSLPDLMRDLKF